ncbi:hypothetical protein HYDPIDRAFT_29328 [Hydnomerulius pinastri MD-312]|uniref:Uncharacterized protein n=1 Tax=Hydnomerulius pinastri MD-312 TaxID=994086 RepID=A0A0C9VYT0_9AGAM|nr:hypothetical protein HYDPIDRAFT_29328 [Hydnomerulius pinastri MD-312]
MHTESILQRIERWKTQPPDEEERIEFLQTAIHSLADSGNVAVFKNAMKTFGDGVIKAATSFKRVSDTFLDLVERYGDRFRELEKWENDWGGLRNHWDAIIGSSQSLATRSGIGYRWYDEFLLQKIQEAKTREDIARITQELKTFSNEELIGIPSNLSDMFLKLRRDIEWFRDGFYEYLDKEGIQVSEKAEGLRLAIEGLQKDILSLNEKKTRPLYSRLLLGGGQVSATSAAPYYTLNLPDTEYFPPFSQPVGAAIAGTILGNLCSDRDGKYRELAEKEADLELVNRDQQALAYIRSQFDSVGPDFINICKTLNILTNTWAAFHGQALQFSHVIEKLTNPKQFPLEFQLQVQLARQIAKPLEESLRDYASRIIP